MARSLSLSAFSCSRADMCLRFLVLGIPELSGVLFCTFMSFVFGGISECNNSAFDP